MSKNQLMQWIWLPLLFSFFGCYEIKKQVQGGKTSTKKKWEGSPYVEWESPKFANTLVLRMSLPQGILAYEGRKGRGAFFTTEKGLMVGYDGGRQVWRRALRPHFQNPLSPYSSRGFLLSGAKGGVLVTWVRGDLLRAQSLKTGRDVWNRPACRAPVKVKGALWAICLQGLHQLDPSTGRPLKRLKVKARLVSLYPLGPGVLAMDKRSRLLFFDLKGGAPSVFERRPKPEHVAATSKGVYLLYRDAGRFILELLKWQKPSLYSGPVRSLWTARLSLFPSTFWVHEHGDTVVHPTGLDCMMARASLSGSELWTSCGVYLFNPPSYDLYGMYMLSSRRKKGGRPIIFVDGDNGLQTSLFRTGGAAGVDNMLATFLAPGKIRDGMVYGVGSNSKIVAIRVAAPSKKEQKEN